MRRTLPLLLLAGCGGDAAGPEGLEALPLAVRSPTGLVLVEWDPSAVVARIDGFSLQRAPAREGAFEELFYLDRSRRSLVDYQVAPDDRWYYRVVALQGSQPVAASEVSAATSTTVLPHTRIDEAPPTVLDTNEVTLRWSGQSTIGAGEVEAFSWRLDGEPWRDPAPVRERTLAALGVGEHFLEVRALDERGNLDPTPARADFTVELDHDPRVTILSADDPDHRATYERDVALRLRARDVAEVKVGEAPDLAGAEWHAYAPSLPFTLDDGEGEKTVYARFRSSDGAETATVSDSIAYDRTPPVPRVTFPADGFATYADSVTIYGEVDDVSPVHVRAGGAAHDDASATFLLLDVPLEVGENLVAIEFEDAVGLRATVDLTLWRHPPTGECAF